MFLKIVFVQIKFFPGFKGCLENFKWCNGASVELVMMLKLNVIKRNQ